MSITITNIGTGTTSIGTVTVPAGSLIVVGTSEITNPTPGTISDTAGNTYVAAQTQVVSTAYLGTIFYVKNCLALSSGTITFTPAGTSPIMSAFYATGVDTTSPLDLHPSVSYASTTTPSLASGTPAVAGELFAALIFQNGTRTFTQDTTNSWATPFNQSVNGSQQLNGGSQVNSGSSAITFAPTLSSANNGAIIIATFKPQAATTANFGGMMRMLGVG